MKRTTFAVLCCLTFLRLSSTASSQVIISEFMASNSSNTNVPGKWRDENQEFSDWIELRNTGNTPVNLRDWALTDNPGQPFLWRFPDYVMNPGAFLVVFASGKDRNELIPPMGTNFHTNFRLSANGEYLALVMPDGTNASVFNPYGPQVPDISYGFGTLTTNETFVASNAAVRVQVPASGSDGLNWTGTSYNDSAWALGTNGVGFSAAPFVRTDIRAAMSNFNASAYLRLPFTVNNLSNLTLLTVRMRYDDGFVAYLNGVEILRANAPDPVAFNSQATAAHAATVVEEFRLGTNSLQAGPNVLAIQGLNVSAVDPDFLIAAELIGTRLLASSDQPVYFTRPTPGADNNSGTPILGPALLDETHSPNVPQDSEDVVVTVRVVPTFQPVTSVVMRYRIMFGAETELPMLDDGAHGDGLAGDGVYAATIPAAASTNSQMVRWFFRATDSQGNVSRWPIFSAPTQTEYLGTIVEPVNLVSKLPIIHLFAPASVLQASATASPGTADLQNGSRGVSVFYDGEFYDNIRVAVRGNTTATYTKKSHRFEFNPDHTFRHSGPGPRIRETSFIADYPDPAYMRQGLCYWMGDLIGCPSPFYIPHRLQLNGQFYQLANHNDVGGEELLARLGYNSSGALFNAMGQVTPGRASTGGPEKKNRQWDSVNGDIWYDYTALASAVAETVPNAARRTNAFQLFDVPQVINYLVTGRWSHENDDVWANMSLYHDNDGDNLWRIVPFDMNLSWGAIFAEGSADLYNGVQSTNDNHKAHPMYGSSQNLALSGPGGGYNRVYDTFFQVPELRQMYLRRMRTMLDRLVGPPGTPINTSPAEQRILEIYNLIYEEAVNDRAWWGWPAQGGQSSFLPPPNPGTVGTAQRTNAAIFSITNGVSQMLEFFVRARRQHFYGKHSITNTALTVGIGHTNGAGIPQPQPGNAVITICGLDANPSSGNQLHEYVCVTNLTPVAIDLEGWSIQGGINFTFHPGTVIPGNSVLYVSPNVRAFRTRTTGPRGNQGLFIVGPYQGQLSARGETLQVFNNFGQLLNSFTYPGAPSAAQQHLRITEIMYNPTPLAGNTNDPQVFEYLELRNISGSVTLNLAGVRFINGIEFDFTGSAVTSLAPGARVLVVKDLAAYTARYGASASVAGQYTGFLENSGERVQLVDAAGEEILDFDYESDWYPITDGFGFSLVVVNENAEPDLWNSKTNWRASGLAGGSPGQTDPAPPVFAPVVINEVLSRTDTPPPTDSIELYNSGAAPADISGWFLTDDFNAPKKYRIANGTSVAAGGYLVFNESQFNVGPEPFALSSDGDEVYLFSADLAGNLTGYVDGFAFGAADNATSFGRHTISTARRDVVALASLTLNTANSGPKVGPIVISEVMYHPPDLSDGSDNSADEFIELSNISGGTVQLYDAAAPTNTWRITGGVDFDFPTNQSLAAGAYLLLVNFDPGTNATANAAFRAKYGVGAGVPLYGPYEGKLNNDSDQIRLRKPAPAVLGVVPYVLVDAVDYEDMLPWPTAADGSGASLQRPNTSAYGNDPVNWTAAVPTAGGPLGGGAVGIAPTVNTQPAGQNVVAGSPVTFVVTASGTAPLRYQWRRNESNIGGATNAVLSLANAQGADAGAYSVLVYNAFGSTVSSNATLAVPYPAAIFFQPQSVQVRVRPDPAALPITNATFNIAAYSSSALRYQWRFNGDEIAGATNASLIVSNVQVANGGDYAVAITDDIGTIVSAPATLYPLVSPTVVLPPLGQTVPVGAAVTLSVVASGSPLPLQYEWRLGSRTVASNVVNSFTDFYRFTATNTPGITNLYRVIVRNLANQGVNANAQINVITVSDSDGDGIPDFYEAAYGVGGQMDPMADDDGDGVKNLAEYTAGTDPNNALSYLKIDSISAGSGATLRFNAASNRTYSVQFSDALGAGPWQTLVNLAGQTNAHLEVITDPNYTTNRFYRLAVPQQP